MWARRWALGILFLLLPGAVLAPVWANHGLGADEDDTLYYFPSRSFFRTTLLSGEPPWLNPWVGGGRPYLADPQSAVFYPATWLFLALDPWVAYPASLWLHYSLALWGAYRLLRGLRRSPFAATFGAIAFAFCGFMLAHRAHFAMQHAAAWTPLVFWRLGRYAETGEAQKLAAAAAVAALQLLSGHAQIAALTALGSVVWVLAGDAPRLIALMRVAVAWLAAGGLFAIQAAPTLSYVLQCTRTQRGYMDFVENSWNPLSVVNLWLPMFFGQRTPNFFDARYWGPSHQVEQFVYVGVAPLILALLAIAGGWQHIQRRAWVALLVFSVLLALGLYGPICPLLYWAPGASLFRVPARAWLLASLAIAALAAAALDDLSPKLSPKMARARASLQLWLARPVTLVGAAALTPALLAALAAVFLTGAQRSAALGAARPWSNGVWVSMAVMAATVLLLRTVAQRWQSPQWRMLLPLALLVDLGIIGWTIDVPRQQVEPAHYFRNEAEWIDVVREGGGRLWIVTARVNGAPGEYVDSREKLVANVNILRQVPLLSDYGPLQPRSLDARLGLKPWGEAPDAERLLADTGWMDGLDVRWVLLWERSWPAPQGCELVLQTAQGARLYRNSNARGVAFLSDASAPGALQTARLGNQALRVSVGGWSGDYPEVGGAGAETLVVSTLALAGWSARVDGAPAAVGAVDGLLLGIRAPRGARQVEFRYFPPGLIPGAFISLSSAVALLLICVMAGGLRPVSFARRRRRQGRMSAGTRERASAAR